MGSIGTLAQSLTLNSRQGTSPYHFFHPTKVNQQVSFLRLFLQQDFDVHIWSGLSRGAQHDLTDLQNLLGAAFFFLVNFNGAQEGLDPLPQQKD